jgi:uncharacterized protein with ATP-grasp and redox domains
VGKIRLRSIRKGTHFSPCKTEVVSPSPIFPDAIFTHTKNKKRNDSKKGKSYLGDARSDAKRFRRTSRKPRTIVQTRQTLCVEWSAICGVLAAENAKEKVRVKIRIKNKKSLGGELDFSHLKCSCWFLSSSSFVHTQKYILEKVHKKAHAHIVGGASSFGRPRTTTTTTTMTTTERTTMSPEAEEMRPMVPFPHIKDVSAYEPTTFEYNPGDTHPQPIKKRDWIRVFRMSLPEFTKRAKMDASVEDSERKSEIFQERFEKYLDDLNENEDDKLNVIHMCRFRDECLRKLGFYDCFQTVKREENVKALEALPRVLERLDNENAGILELVKGVFAGNIFDLGAAASQALFSNNNDKEDDIAKSFFETRDTKTDVFVVNDFDSLKNRWNDMTRVHEKCCIFVDNAGADAILGVLPLAREMLKRGTKVVLCANDVPSINDITIKELEELVFPTLLQMNDKDNVFKKAIESKQFTCIGSGSDLPVIDLREISEPCANECLDCDLVVLIGMGRGIETNLRAEFSIDRINLGMVKHKEVAQLLGGPLYSCVCKFDSAKV